MTYARLASWLLVWLTVALPAHAHHSRAAFALDSQLEFEGSVVEMGWQNPHAYLVVEQSSDGARWTFEAHSISGLLRLGWKRDSLPIGDRVVVVANPSRRDEPYALLDHVTRSNGITLYSFRKPASAQEPAPRKPLAGSDNFAGTWKPILKLRKALVGGFRPPANWPYTELAKTEIAQFDLNQDPALNCVSTGMPRMVQWPYSQRWQRFEDRIVITTDQSTNLRTIHLGELAITRAPSVVGSSQGRIGRKGHLDILTDGFSAERWGNARGVSSSSDKTVRETYELVNGGYELTVTYELRDPAYLQAPVTVSNRFALVADYEFNQVPCDPATARRHLKFEH